MNTYRHHLLAVVATVHHDRVGQTLNDGAESLSESLLVVSASSVRQELLVLLTLVDGDVILMKILVGHVRSNELLMHENNAFI